MTNSQSKIAKNIPNVSVIANKLSQKSLEGNAISRIKQLEERLLFEILDLNPKSKIHRNKSHRSKEESDKTFYLNSASLSNSIIVKDGIKPKDSKGKGHKVLKFPMLRSSIMAYQKNLNTHKAYGEFREKRALLREKNKKISGLDLAPHLESYAATGKDYVKILTSIISQNKLTDFDNSNLMNTNNASSLVL